VRRPDGSVEEVRARHVLLATGGAGQLFAVTTNPVEVTGDGIAMALRAGAAVADVEFVQFHPTALHHPQMPRPLLSEALRGHGALLRDANGDRFVDELLPRDAVSRAETRRMLELGVDHCWLDATGLEQFDLRFPTISAALRSVGLDPATDWLPIAPAAHYLCGGVVADLDGATSLPGLWAAGEVACSGVHGANRLASNSLLEGMVFGHRVVEAIDRGVDGPSPTGAMRAVLGSTDRGAIGGRPVTGWSPYPWRAGGAAAVDEAKVRDRLQRAMTTGAGVLRSADSLAETGAVVEEIAAEVDGTAPGELRNLVETARALLAAATARTESRGAHTRADFPDRDDAVLRARLVTGGPTPAIPG
jgi:L-aspartate oxidase